MSSAMFRRMSFTYRKVENLVGREAEKKLCCDEIDELAKNPEAPPHGIIIEAEAGMGKSLLLSEALGYALVVGVEFGLGGGTQLERNTPYFPWRALIEQMFDLGGKDRLDTRKMLGDPRN